MEFRGSQIRLSAVDVLTLLLESSALGFCGLLHRDLYRYENPLAELGTNTSSQR
jgi:hypothetical protein